jgi:hypothetical protein
MDRHNVFDHSVVTTINVINPLEGTMVMCDRGEIINILSGMLKTPLSAASV